MNLQATAAAAELIAAAEGFRAHAYDDATGAPVLPGSTLQGHVTIGYGRALDLVGVTQEEAALLRDNSIAVALADAQAVLGDAAWLRLDPARQAALIDMAYTLGRAGLAAFHLLIAALARGDWPAAHDAALASAWARTAARRARRDAQIFLTGQLPA